jgi:DNA-binding ferritin-like protein
MKTLNFSQFLNEGATADNAYGYFILNMLAFRTQAHIFHWQTKKYSTHVALGGFYDAYILLVDTLAESMMSKFGTPVIGVGNIKIVDYSEENINLFLNEAYSLFENEGRTLCADNTEMLNVIDEIVGEINKLKYLLTLS